jgi:hypothetical protein
MTMSSCKKYFDVQPSGKVAEQQFYQNINEFQDALYAGYAVLKDQTFQNTLALLGDGISDDFVYQFSVQASPFGSDGYKLEQFNIASNNIWVQNWYQENYTGIYRVNQLLKHIEDSIQIYYTPTDESSIIMWRHIYGQALFLRGYYYFNLVKAFGGVPIQPVDPTVGNQTFPRASKDSVYAYIEKDLRTAALLLHPNPGTGINYGSDANNVMHYNEPSKFSALSLLMKVLIYQAKPGVASEKWMEAKKIGDVLFNSILNNGDHSLTFDDVLHLSLNFPGTTWNQLKLRFKYNLSLDSSLNIQLRKPDGTGVFLTGSGYSSTKGFYTWQNIWRVQYQNDVTNHNVLFCAPAMTDAIYSPSTYAITTFVDYIYAVERVDNAPLIPTTGLFNEMYQEKGDPRNYYGCVTNQGQPIGANCLAIFNEGGMGGQGDENKYIFLKHFLVAGSELGSSDLASPRNLLLMRYNDYALFYAEALNETGDPISAIQIINAMRSYMVKNLPPIGGSNFNTNLPYGPYEYTRESIWHERRIELAGEYDRFWDIVRQGRAAEVMNNPSVEAIAISKVNRMPFIKGVNEILPIPQTEIELSNGIITQNPGY